MGEPDNPAEGLEGLTSGPFLVKVDRYGSVSGLVKVKVALGTLFIKRAPTEEDSFGS